MLTVLFVLITVMSAVLGIMNQHPRGSNSYNSDNTAGLLDTLLQRMYVNSSSPYESNITDFIGPKYEALLGKPLLEMLERKKEDTRAEKGQDTIEHLPKWMKMRQNSSIRPISSVNNALKTKSSENSSNSSELETVLRTNEELKPLKKVETLNENIIKEHIRENLKENLSHHFKENLKEHLNENFQEKFKENLNSNFDESHKKKSKYGLSENLEPIYKGNKEFYKRTDSHHKAVKSNFTQQKLQELAELEQVLRYFTLLMEHQSGHISSPKCASSNATIDTNKANATIDTDKANATINTDKTNATIDVDKANIRIDADKTSGTLNNTADISQGSIGLIESTPSTNIIANFTEVLANLPANFSDDLNVYKPQSKNLSHFMRNSSALTNNGSNDLSPTDQNIELFQNYFSYRKIPYPVLSLHPLLANWSQAVASMNSTIHSSKTKPKHSWIHQGLSNNSFHMKNSLTDPINKAQIQLEKPTNQKLANDSNRHKAVDAPQTTQASIFPTITSRISATRSELVLAKMSPLPHHFNSHSGDVDPAELLRRCWIELNKTKSEIKLHETTKPEAITCIIPRQNTSIYYGRTAEPETRGTTTKSSCFCKLFNRKEKKDKKKKITPCTTVSSYTMNIKEHTKSMVSSTHKTRSESDHNDKDCDKDHEVYDEGINKILEEVSSKMCLPNMIHRLLDLVCQNGTNCSSSSWEQSETRSSPHRISENHHGHNENHHGQNENHRSHSHDHIRSHHDHTLSATRLGGNDYKARWENHSYPTSKFDENTKMLKSHPMINKFDRDSLRGTKQKLRLDGNKASRDLSNLLFLIGINKNRDTDESNLKSKPSLENFRIDTAYVQP